MTIEETIGRITHPDAAIAAEVQRALDGKTKPRGSLGRLEALAVQVASIRGLLKPAISKPPSLVRMSNGSERSGLFTPSARSMTWVLRRRPSSSRPVPRPTTSAGGSASRAAHMALAAVVLPMPISPMPSNVTPFATNSVATRMPMLTAAAICARVMAGPSARFAVPAASRSRRMTAAPGVSGSGDFTPMSTTITSAPTWRASTLMAAPPAAKLSSIWPVTSAG